MLTFRYITQKLDSLITLCALLFIATSNIHAQDCDAGEIEAIVTIAVSPEINYSDSNDEQEFSWNGVETDKIICR